MRRKPRHSLFKRRPLVVGLTGGVGCGKTVVAQAFARRGAVIISGDEVGHDVVDNNPVLQKKLADAFGRDVLVKRGIDRRKLARLAFATPEDRQRHNELVHPPLVKELARRIDVARRISSVPMVVVDAALLVEWKMKKPIDLLIAIRASRKDRSRWLLRRGWKPAEIRDRMRAQLPFAARAKVADYVLRNDGDLAALRRKAGRLWQKIVGDH